MSSKPTLKEKVDAALPTIGQTPAQKAKRIMDNSKRSGKPAKKVADELVEAGPGVATAASLINQGHEVAGDDSDGAEKQNTFIGMDKDELLDYIVNLELKRREANRKAIVAKELVQERIEELPAYEDLVKAKEDIRLVSARLNEQKDGDDTFLNRNAKLTEANQYVTDLEGSLSDALVAYAIATRSKTIHTDQDEPESIDREIKFTAKIGKKVPAQLDMFDQAGGDADV